MREDHRGIEESFYRDCAELLGASHSYVPWTGRGPNRWNNRRAGNGRFPGFGTIRFFSPNAIHVCLHTPAPANRMARSVDEALGILRSIVGSDPSVPVVEAPRTETPAP